MKQLLVLIAFQILSFTGFCQLTLTKTDGGSVVTKLEGSLKVNDGSSLRRDYITINDPTCPLQLNTIGVETSYRDPGYVFKPSGTFQVTEPIVAYEVHHVLYDVFGEHMKTLSNQEVIDVEGKGTFSVYSTWYASEDNVEGYLICVSYVANVRTKSGKIWRYSYRDIKGQLDKLKIVFEEGYAPKKNSDKEK